MMLTFNIHFDCLVAKPDVENVKIIYSNYVQETLRKLSVECLTDNDEIIYLKGEQEDLYYLLFKLSKKYDMTII